MNSKTVYTPILKAKEGEFRGLLNTDFEILNKLLPLFEIPNITWDYENNEEKKSIESHLSNISTNLEKSIGKRDFFIDSNYIDEERITENGDHHLIHIFRLFNISDLKGIPVVSFHNTINYQNAINYINENFSTGICIRIKSEDILQGNLNERLFTLLSNFKLTEEKVSLIFDLKDISETEETEQLYISTIDSITNLNNYSKWKYIAVACTSMLKELSSIQTNSRLELKRIEWQLYCEKVIDKNRINFGDYSCFYPEITEVNPRFIQVSANIKYTCENYWIIERGSSTKINGNEQYRVLSQNIVEDEQFQGLEFSWGDQKIFDCANNIGTAGSASTWRQVMNCHHFTYVINQLSN